MASPSNQCSYARAPTSKRVGAVRSRLPDSQSGRAPSTGSSTARPSRSRVVKPSDGSVGSVMVPSGPRGIHGKRAGDAFRLRTRSDRHEASRWVVITLSVQRQSMRTPSSHPDSCRLLTARFAAPERVGARRRPISRHLYLPGIPNFRRSLIFARRAIDRPPKSASEGKKWDKTVGSHATD